MAIALIGLTNEYQKGIRLNHLGLKGLKKSNLFDIG
jgi:hypothetical protein